MEVLTDQPGLQFYSGNFFNGKSIGKYGRPQSYRESVALETQHFPDSPNHENFPTTRLNRARPIRIRVSTASRRVDCCREGRKKMQVACSFFR